MGEVFAYTIKGISIEKKEEIEVKKTILFLCATVLLNSCFTPLPMSDVDRLTTCNGKTIDQIEKNLMLNGYAIKTKTSSGLTTEFKQISGYGSSKSSQSIIVIQLELGVVKFRVRYREESYQSMNTGRTTVGSGDNQITSVQKQYVPTADERDEKYWVERMEKYLNMQRMVCGS